MIYGLRLSGRVEDIAALRALSEVAPALVTAPWTELHAAGHRESVVTVHGLDLAAAQQLRARGLDVVRIARNATGCHLAPFQKDRAAATWPAVCERHAPSLPEVVRPVRSPSRGAHEEACFLVPVEAPGAHATLERLLALGRDDVTVAELLLDGERLLAVFAPRPPMYLLLRAFEEPGEGVRGYVRLGDGDLWVAYGYTHPLGGPAAAALKRASQLAFVTADGTWLRAPAPLAPRSIYDAIVPEFHAAHTALAPAPGETRFKVRLRLALGPPGDPELWFLDPAQFLALEPLLDSLSSEELSRFTVARMTGPEGTVYLLQEIVRPGQSRLATRVSDLLGVPGYLRTPGADNLYLPAGRRLLPVMRRDELRALLGLDRARLVVLTEDADGPRVVTVPTLDEAPLSRWVDYAATDRRVELDRLAEESVFEFLPVQVARAPKPVTEKDRPEREDPARPPRIERPRPALSAPVEEEIPVEIEEEPDDLVALRELVRSQEKSLAAGGVVDGSLWRSTAEGKARLGDLEESCACFEAALFHGGDALDLGTVSMLASLRARQSSAPGTLEGMVDLAVQSRLTPTDAAYLGARVLEKVLRGETDSVLEGVYQSCDRVFSAPELPVSRRLAWLVVLSLHRRTGDRLGLTRARERLLGGLNDRGLLETYDMPRFVRYALALDGDGAAGAEARSRVDQSRLLEELWERALSKHVQSLSPKGSYARLCFALGFLRLGQPARSRDLVEPVEAELAVHEAPNQVLYRLYLSRMAHVATQGTEEAWVKEVESTLAQVKQARVKDRVEWLRKRSAWLRTPAPEDAPPGLRPGLERALAAAEEQPSTLGGVLVQTLDNRDLFDFEVTLAIERLLRAALRSGSDERIAEVLQAARARLTTRITILGHRARAIGACIRAAATLGDASAVDGLLDDVVLLASAPDLPSVRDLLAAVGPGLTALRRLGIVSSARRFLEALVPIASKGGREGARLRAALADGFLQLREPERADELLDTALDETLRGNLDHVGRYEAGAAVLGALQRWAVTARAPRAHRVLDQLDVFKDTFTASQHNLYETHKVLILERLVDAVADETMFQGTRVQGYLDAEEQSLRRRILADWRSL